MVVKCHGWNAGGWLSLADGMQTFMCMDLFLLNDVIVFHQRANTGGGGVIEVNVGLRNNVHTEFIINTWFCKCQMLPHFIVAHWSNKLWLAIEDFDPVGHNGHILNMNQSQQSEWTALQLHDGLVSDLFMCSVYQWSCCRFVPHTLSRWATSAITLKSCSQCITVVILLQHIVYLCYHRDGRHGN